MFAAENDVVVIDIESSQVSGHWAGQSQLAGGIKKKKHMLPRPVSRARAPKAGPFADGEGLSGAYASYRPINSKSDSNGWNTRRGKSLHRVDRTAKNEFRSLGKLAQNCSRWLRLRQSSSTQKHTNENEQDRTHGQPPPKEAQPKDGDKIILDRSGRRGLCWESQFQVISPGTRPESAQVLRFAQDATSESRLIQ